MKPYEILSSLPQWAGLGHDAIVDSPAFAMPCRLGEESVSLVLGAAHPADTIDLSIQFDGEPHVLSIARTPRFSELNAIWDSRADMPEQMLLALVEKEAGPFLQLVENIVRRQLRLVGLAASGSIDARTVFAQVSDVVFSLTRSAIVVAALGNLRNIDLSHETVRSSILPTVAEYATFALAPADAAGLEVGDAILLPEIGTVPARLVADGRFAVDGNGVSRYEAGELAHVVDAMPHDVTLGELFDAAESPRVLERQPSGALRLVADGRTLAVGRLDRLSAQPAFIVESTSH